MPSFLTLPTGALAILLSLAGHSQSPHPGAVSSVRADSVTAAVLDSAAYGRLQARMRRAYPPLFWDAGVSGRVIMRFVVRADGTVDPRTVRVLYSTDPGGYFASAAERVVRPLRFRPATRDGTAVPAALEATLNFVPRGKQEASFRAVIGD
jgi:TonB family protein